MSHRSGFLGALVSNRRLELLLANMRTLHAQITRLDTLQDADTVELLRVLAECFNRLYRHSVLIKVDGPIDADAAPCGDLAV